MSTTVKKRPKSPLLAALTNAKTLAFIPTSNFRVGAVAQGLSGTLYLGANFEIPGQQLNLTVHAEQAALANAYAHGEKGITAIATSTTPCGHCRQFINEIKNGSAIRIVVDKLPPTTLAKLLPKSFGPKDLKKKARLFASPEFTITIADTSDPLIEIARQAAAKSYAPHSKSPSGCAIQLKSGATISGSYLENAAYNPSLAPLLTALVQGEMRRASFADITRVVLVELKGAKISQREGTELVMRALRALGMTATLEVALGLPA